MSIKLSLLGLGVFGYLNIVAALYTNLSLSYHDLATVQYALSDSYTSSNFWSSFSFFSAADPTHGFVSYKGQAEAVNSGLANTNGGKVFFGVDHKTVNPAAGRASVRLTSKKVYNHGLFIADIAHMPGSICGVWPSWWMFGPNWPTSGEVDIIEGVNQNTFNTMTLHTSAGCTMSTAGSGAGTTALDSNCNKDNGSTGCGTTNKALGNAYGDPFNANGGGVYAMQWESSGINIWFFPRNKIPADIASGKPAIANWGTPVSAFKPGSGCNIDAHFKDMSIVFDTTFCGDWAGQAAIWSQGTCGKKAASCQAFVAANPDAFANAYWSVNYVKVFKST